MQSATSASDTRSETVDTRLGASRVEAPTSPNDVQPRESILIALAERVTTQRTPGVVKSGKRRVRRLQNRRQRDPVRMQPEATLPLLKHSGLGLLLADGNRRGVETRRSKGHVVKATTTTPPPKRNPNLNQSRRRPSSLN